MLCVHPCAPMHSSAGTFCMCARWIGCPCIRLHTQSLSGVKAHAWQCVHVCVCMLVCVCSRFVPMCPVHLWHWGSSDAVWMMGVCELWCSCSDVCPALGVCMQCFMCARACSAQQDMLVWQHAYLCTGAACAHGCGIRSVCKAVLHAVFICSILNVCPCLNDARMHMTCVHTAHPVGAPAALHESTVGVHAWCSRVHTQRIHAHACTHLCSHPRCACVSPRVCPRAVGACPHRRSLT